MSPLWADEDPSQEECQEGYSVLCDGLRCQRNGYESLYFTPEPVLFELFPDRQRYLGRTTFVNTLCGKQVLEGKDADDPEHAHEEEGVRIKPVTVGKSTRLKFPPRQPIIQMLTIPVSQSLSWMRREPASP
jgi:hypothetical protein